MFHPSQPDAYWRRHDDGFKLAEEGFVRSDTDGKPLETYTTVENLGGGSFGVTYSAISDKQRDPSGAKQKPTHVLKVILQSGAYEDAYDTAMLEYYASVLIDRVGKEFKNEVCNIRAVCAQHVFTSEKNIVIVFPYENATSLAKFNLDGFHESFEKDNYAYQLELFQLAYWMCDAVRVLNSFGIYHRDIKPANMIVTLPLVNSGPVPTTTGLKLIDFGETCASREEIARVRQVEDPLWFSALTCDTVNRRNRFFYVKGATRFIDPLAQGNLDNVGFRFIVKFEPTEEMNFGWNPYMVEYDEANMKIMFPKFEMFACAMSIDNLVNIKPYTSLVPREIDVNEPRLTTSMSDMLLKMTNLDWRARPSSDDICTFFYNEHVNLVKRRSTVLISTLQTTTINTQAGERKKKHRHGKNE